MTVVGPFSQKVSDFVAKAKRKPTKVWRESTKELVAEAQTPLFAGGHMPVGSGYQRASLRVLLNSVPLIEESSSRVKHTVYSYSPAGPNSVIDQARLGKDKINIGWTAAYSRVNEGRFGFARLAAQNWRSIVDRVAERVAREE